MSVQQIAKRVLVIDNDVGVRKTTKELLEPQYQVAVAEGIREALIENAHRSLRESRCHLAILDLRLLNDNDPKDWSGFELAAEIRQNYPWVDCVFLTGYESFELARRALADRIAIDLALKQHGPVSLIETVDRSFLKIPCRWDQELQWASGLDLKKLLRPLTGADAPDPLDFDLALSELTELFGRLFPEADKLHLATLTDSGATSSPNLGHALLLRVSAHQAARWLEEVVVKVGRREGIQCEVANYDRYVDGQVGDFHYTARRAYARTWRLGGIAYALIGTNLDEAMTLQRYYQRRDLNLQRDLTPILAHLFEPLVRRWRAEPRIEYSNLADCYCKALDLDETRLNRLELEPGEWMYLDGLGRPLPNPVEWLKRYADNSEVETGQRIVHGDLHSRNIFVALKDKRVWLIDFERTEISHCLRDYIELETDIKFSLLTRNPNDLAVFYHLEVALLSQELGRLRTGRYSPPPDVRAQPEMERAFLTITQIRHWAASEIRFPNLRDYFWGVLCQTLFVATRSHLPPETRARALLSAALSCERLGDGRYLNEDWPPPDPFSP